MRYLKYFKGVQTMGYFTNGYGTAIVDNEIPLDKKEMFTILYENADGIRQVLYYSPSIKDYKTSNIPIEEVLNGFLVEFEGEKFLTLGNRMLFGVKTLGLRAFDSGTGTDSEKMYVNPSRPSNIGYWLNVDYYNSLSPEFKDAIEPTIWLQGGQNTEMNISPPTQSQVLTVANSAMFNQYSELLDTDGIKRIWAGSTSSLETRPAAVSRMGAILSTDYTAPWYLYNTLPTFRLKEGTIVKLIA